VDGGACRNDLLMELQANLLGKPLVRPRDLESTARGAAMLAGLGLGWWRDETELTGLVATGASVIEPCAPQTSLAGLRARWHRAVQRAEGWASADDA